MRPTATWLCIAFVVISAVGLRAVTDSGVATIKLKQGDSIIFFGDSLTALAGQEAPREHVTKGYVRFLRETLSEFEEIQMITIRRNA